MLRWCQSLVALNKIYLKPTTFYRRTDPRLYQVSFNSTSVDMSDVDGNTVVAQSLKKQVCGFLNFCYLFGYLFKQQKIPEHFHEYIYKEKTCSI